jgi:glycosyltransferase involved in cell wall biosynthesis
MHGPSNENEKKLPLISIAIVVYNGIEYIQRALDSIVQQPYKNIELIVVDGGSNDGTLGVLSEYSAHISKMVSEPDKGIYDAMNKACTLATGDWLIFLGCDDVMLQSLGSVAKMLSQPDTVYYGDVIVRSSGKVSGEEFSKYKFMRFNICHQSMFYPKSVYKKYSYCLDYPWYGDYDYNLRLVGDAVQFVYMGIVIAIYNDKGLSSSGDAEFEKNRMKLIRATFGIHYVFMEIVRRQKEKIKRPIKDAVKTLFPEAVWKRCQSVWRKIR